MVARTSAARSPIGSGVRRLRLRIAAAATAQPPTKYELGSMTTGGAAGAWKESLTPILFPIEECSPCNAESDGNDRGASLDKEADRQDARLEEVLQFHFHIIVTNIVTNISERTRAG